MELFCYHFHRKKVIFVYDNEYILYLDDDLFEVETDEGGNVIPVLQSEPSQK